MQGSESTCASYSRVALPRCQGPASGIRSHHCPHPGPSASFSPRPHSSLGCPPAHTDLLAPGLASPSFSFVADGDPVPSEAICSHVAHGASGAPWRKSSMGRSERPRLGQHVRLSPVGPRAGHSQIRFLHRKGPGRSCWRSEPWRPGGGDLPSRPRLLLQRCLHPALGSW